MNEQLTDWYPVDSKPVRAGVYETRVSFGWGYTYWRGDGWANQRDSIGEADQLRHWGLQDKEWRGLASDPNA